MSWRVGLACVAGVLSLVSADAHAQSLISPGELSRFHSQLEGDDHCNDCHSSGRQVSDNRCLNCHTDLRARVRARAGLHGDEYRGRECAPCHVEHIGRGVPQIRWPGGNKNNFDHALSGWPLRGAHRQEECSDCHNRGRSFLGLRTACASCHSDDDPHDGRLSDCQDCHSETRWTTVDLDGFNHDQARFHLRGEHRNVECAECHHNPPRYSGLEFSTCSSCHTDPHEGRMGAACSDCHSEDGWSNVSRARENHPGLSLARGHRRVACETCHDRGAVEPPSRGSRCVNCHRAVHEAPFGRNCQRCHGSIRWTGLPRRIGVRAHSRTAFELHGAHGEVECSSCHDPELSPNARFRELEHEQCGSCHEDPHTFAFQGAAGFDCTSCHTDDAFAPTSFTTELHASTSFPLTGTHSNVACMGCHGSERPRLAFGVEDQACADCHDNPHGTQFAVEMADDGCASCHSTAGWNRPNIDHNTWPLTGAHENAACESCHTPSDEDRRSGRGASYRGVARECAGCHADDHAGQFRLSEPVRQCPACHTTDGFSIASFDHEALTGFPLVGRHGALECAGCHRPADLGEGEQTTRWRLGYNTCADCHANPHDSQRRDAPEPNAHQPSYEPNLSHLPDAGVDVLAWTGGAR